MIRIGKLGATLLCLSYLTSCLLFYELGCGSSTTTTTTTSFIRDESFKKKRVSDVNNGTTWRSTDSIPTTVLDDTLERAYVASTEMLHVSHSNEEDEYDDALARYAALGLLKNKKNIDDDDDTTPEMMLEYSMKRLDALQRRAENETQPIDMQAAVAAAIDAAAALEAKKMKKNPPQTDEP